MTRGAQLREPRDDDIDRYGCGGWSAAWQVDSGLLTAALNMPSLYFEVEVHWYSYAIAVVATLAFALLVQLFTNPVLDRVDPVSSLKSVE